MALAATRWLDYIQQKDFTIVSHFHFGESIGERGIAM
jgi:hypothetical protein